MLLKWAGGKAWLTRNHPYVFHSKESLLSNDSKQHSVKYNRYIDPFVGGGAVFKHLQPSKSLISDINEELITYYKCLQSSPTELFNEVKSHFKNHSKDYYYQTRKEIKINKLEASARFLYLNYTCFNGIYRVNKKNEFNVPIGDNSNFHYELKDFKNYSKLLRNTKIKLQDFRETIAEAKKGDLLYVDPPYVTKSKKSTFDKYSPKVFSWQDQDDLSSLLYEKSKEGVSIVLSNINDTEIVNIYPISKGWSHKPIDRANSLAYRPQAKKYKEIIISNL
tara:strand:- start:55 stop:888 length:834 start_codon:yes stop_codon:yes gene_type:complete